MSKHQHDFDRVLELIRAIPRRTHESMLLATAWHPQRLDYALQSLRRRGLIRCEGRRHWVAVDKTREVQE